MTREEAIIVLKYGMKYRNPKNDTEKDRNEALDMAISALSENKGENRPKGEWTDWLGNGNEWECSRCKCSIESHGSIAYNFCPMCGADMRGKSE